MHPAARLVPSRQPSDRVVMDQLAPVPSVIQCQDRHFPPAILHNLKVSIFDQSCNVFLDGFPFSVASPTPPFANFSTDALSITDEPKGVDKITLAILAFSNFNLFLHTYQNAFRNLRIDLVLNAKSPLFL